MGPSAYSDAPLRGVSHHIYIELYSFMRASRTSPKAGPFSGRTTRAWSAAPKYNANVATTGEPRVDAAGIEAWRELFEAKPERQGELHSTMSGIENEPLYSPESGPVDYEAA